MQRLRLFLLVLTITVGVLFILIGVSWYLAVTSPSYYQSSWMGQMWGGMGRGGMGGSMMGYSGSFLWMIPVGLIAVVILAVIGASFYLVFPQIRSSKATCGLAQTKPIQTISTTGTVSEVAAANKATTNSIPGPGTCDVLLKSMTPEEQRVLNILRTHKGKYLQKYIGKEAGLSRLKTHRIIARFAERGIVTAEKFGNTNEIVLSDWALTSESQNAGKQTA